ncbi:MAG TPA: hypothetical protein VFI15_08755 [Candidatus Limnocylindrales bacterium]|nr:hypothetical protein [Candidatus Limnocylindrales bacterium]
MGARPAIRLLPAVLLAFAIVAACEPIGSAATPTLAPGATPGPTAMQVWPRPADTLAKTSAAGLVPETVEHLQNHVHAHLDVFLDGVPVVVPAGIGINIDDPGVKSGPDGRGGMSYGGIAGCAQPCISPLHTHDSTGVLHTESASADLNNLGQFFDEWGVRLSSTCVGEYCSPAKSIAIYIDGAAYTGNPREIQLADQREIAIVIGTPPAVIPKTGDFSGA